MIICICIHLYLCCIYIYIYDIYTHIYIYIYMYIRQPCLMSPMNFDSKLTRCADRFEWQLWAKARREEKKQEAVTGQRLGCKSLHHGVAAVASRNEVPGTWSGPTMDAFSVLILVPLRLDTCVKILGTIYSVLPLFCRHLCHLVTNFS